MALLLRARYSGSAGLPLQLRPSRAGRPRLAVALAALPARRIGEAPGLVGPESLVTADDLPCCLCHPDERAAELPGRSAGGDERGADLLAPRTGLRDLCEAELRRRVA